MASDAALAGAPLTFVEQVNPAAVAITVPQNGAVYTYGSPAMIGARVLSVPGVPFFGEATLVDALGAIMATGNVGSDGRVRFVTALSAGRYTAAVHFAGDMNHVAGVSRTFSFTVKPVAAVLALT
jgi:hypothetical protein